MIKDVSYNNRFLLPDRKANSVLSRSIEVQNIDLPKIDVINKPNKSNAEGVVDMFENRKKLEILSRLSHEYVETSKNDNFKLKLDADKLIEQLSINEIKKLSKEINKFDHLEPMQLDAFHKINRKTKWENQKDERNQIYDYRESKKDTKQQKMMARPNKKLRELMREILLR